MGVRPQMKPMDTGFVDTECRNCARHGRERAVDHLVGVIGFGSRVFAQEHLARGRVNSVTTNDWCKMLGTVKDHDQKA